MNFFMEMFKQNFSLIMGVFQFFKSAQNRWRLFLYFLWIIQKSPFFHYSLQVGIMDSFTGEISHKKFDTASRSSGVAEL